MTDGTYTGLDDTAIIELLTAAAAVEADQPDHGGPNDGGPDDSGPNGGDAAAEGVGHEPADGESTDVQPADVEPTSNRPSGQGAGLELRVRLSTLMGLPGRCSEGSVPGSRWQVSTLSALDVVGVL
ncbi:MAG: hypothetical protein ACRDRY_23070 [Pseudonocardiaceae bacterium]